MPRGMSAVPKSRSESPTLHKTRARLQALGVQLRTMWDDIVREPLPDDMMKLLRELDDRERNRSSSH